MDAADPLKVLIVEDDPIISLYAVGLLQDLGHTARLAISAAGLRNNHPGWAVSGSFAVFRR